MIEIHKLRNLQQTSYVYTWIRERQTNQPQQEIQRKSFGTSKINDQSQYRFKESKNSWIWSLSPSHLVPQSLNAPFQSTCLLQLNSQPRHAVVLPALSPTNLPFGHMASCFHLPRRRKLNFLTSMAAMCFSALALQTGILYQMIC